MDMKRTLGDFTTGKGRLVFPLFLNEPDSTYDPHNIDKHKYKAGLRLEGEPAKKLRSQIEEAWEEWLDMVATARGKKPQVHAKNFQWYTSETKPWEGIGDAAKKMLDGLQPDELIIKTGSKAYFKEKLTYPRLFDAAADPIAVEDTPSIGWGSVAKISATIYAWTQKSVASMSFILSAIQLIDVIEPGQAKHGAEDFGFTSTDGFKVDEDTVPFSKVTNDDKGGDF
jgi:hypothetical protein